MSLLHSLWFLLLGIIYYIYNREKSQDPPLYTPPHQDHTPKKLPIPLINSTYITSDSLQVNFTLSSQEGTFNAIILPSNINITQKTLQEIISSRRLDPHVKSIPFIGRNISISFGQLKNNYTYYLYYCEESSEPKITSEVGHFPFQTKPVDNAWNKIKIHNQAIVTTCAVIFMLALCKCGWNWIQMNQKKKAFMESGRGKLGSLANKVANEWNLDLPDNHKKLKLQLKTETLAGKSQKAQEEMKKSNQTMEEGNYEFAERRMCGLCCERPREVVFLNCGHIYSCIKCSIGLSKCPLDKKPIEKIIRYKVADSRDLVEWSSYTKLKHIWSEKFGGNISSGSIKELKGQLDEAEYFSLLKDEQTNYEYFYKCMICNHRDKEVIFEDCQHLVCCEKCAKSCRTCPLDNVQTLRTHHVYFS